MYRLALMILFAATLLVRADDSAFRSYFTYPDVQITMDFGADVGHAQAIPFKNHLNLETPAKILTFQGGWKMSGNRPDT
jgi:hypothetical protein